MENIPLLHIKKRKIVNHKNIEICNIEKLLEDFKDKRIYLYDHDGLNKNKPNLCLYQKFSKYHNLWIDAGFRFIGDLYDSIIAGADSITIRKELWTDTEIEKLKDITECKIYNNINSTNLPNRSNKLFEKIDGCVILGDIYFLKNNFQISEFIKNLSKKIDVYIYYDETIEFSFYKKLNLSGLIIDIEHIKEFKF
jgi:hypothetical protein